MQPKHEFPRPEWISRRRSSFKRIDKKYTGWPEWEKLKQQWQEGDELRKFCSPSLSWKCRCGRQGYVILRNGKVVAYMVTLMN